jgi:hypothetical protein
VNRPPVSGTIVAAPQVSLPVTGTATVGADVVTVTAKLDREKPSTTT